MLSKHPSDGERSASLARPARARVRLTEARSIPRIAPPEPWPLTERYQVGQVLPTASGPDYLSAIVSGWAYETPLSADGRPQIVALRLPGDTIVRGPARPTRLVALTRVEVRPVTLGPRGPGEAAERAMTIATLARQGRGLRDHILRLSALDAFERTVHLLLDLHDRLAQVGLVKAGQFRVPLTQDTFADALGMSVVHVNRVLKRLRQTGLVTLRGGAVALHDLPALRAISLHTTTP